MSTSLYQGVAYQNQWQHDFDNVLQLNSARDLKGALEVIDKMDDVWAKQFGLMNITVTAANAGNTELAEATVIKMKKSIDGLHEHALFNVVEAFVKIGDYPNARRVATQNERIVSRVERAEREHARTLYN